MHIVAQTPPLAQRAGQLLEHVHQVAARAPLDANRGYQQTYVLARHAFGQASQRRIHICAQIELLHNLGELIGAWSDAFACHDLHRVGGAVARS